MKVTNSQTMRHTLVSTTTKTAFTVRVQQWPMRNKNCRDTWHQSCIHCTCNLYAYLCYFEQDNSYNL